MDVFAYLFALNTFFLAARQGVRSSCPTGVACMTGTRLCYWELTSAMTASDANSACAQHGGSLAVFPSAEAEQFVIDNLGIASYTYSGCGSSRCDVWLIGYRDNETEGTFTTWLGEPGTWLPTGGRLKLNGGRSESCMVVWRDTATTLEWQDRSCDLPRQAICYRVLPEVKTSGRWRAVHVGTLRNHVLYHLTARSLVHCAHACQTNVFCSSFTFSRGRGLCQLNDVSPGSSPGDLTSDSDSKTYQMI